MRHRCPAPILGAGRGGGSERWLSHTETRLPPPYLPQLGGGVSSACSSHAITLSPIGGWLFAFRLRSGFHAGLLAGGAGALDLRIFAIQILRRALPMILRRALWPAGFFPKSVRSLPNPFFAIRVSCIRPFRRHAAAPFVYDA